MTKLIVFLTKRPDLTRDEFLHYWRDVHGPLGARMPGVRKYIQNRTTADDALFDCVAEMWFDDAAAMQASFGSPESAAAAADAPNFTAKTQMMIVEEVEML